MAVTVGTDVYVSVADADTYWSNRNNSTWSAALTADKEKALREATQYIDGAFTFIGVLTDDDQPLAWPRSSALVQSGNFKNKLYGVNEIPARLKDANAEMALEALSARLKPVQERGGLIKREQVDVVEVEYMDFAPSGKAFDFVAMILKPLTINKNRLVRV